MSLIAFTRRERGWLMSTRAGEIEFGSVEVDSWQIGRAMLDELHRIEGCVLWPVTYQICQVRLAKWALRELGGESSYLAIAHDRLMQEAGIFGLIRKPEGVVNG